MTDRTTSKRPMQLAAGDVITQQPDHPDRPCEWTVVGRRYGPGDKVDIDFTAADGATGVAVVEPTAKITVLPREVLARDRYVVGLRELADFLTAHPDIRVPMVGNPSFGRAGGDLAMFTGRASVIAAVGAWGRPAEIQPPDSDSSYLGLVWIVAGGLRVSLQVKAEEIGVERARQATEWVVDPEFLPATTDDSTVSEAS